MILHTIRTTITTAKIAALAWVAMVAVGYAACEQGTFENTPYVACTADTPENVQLFLRDDTSQILGGFGAVSQNLPDDKRLVFAMNAGMYHQNRAPVGLYIENGQQQARAQDGGGFGNFGLKPNGVFCVTETGFHVIETHAYLANPPNCTMATQSGPMLVIDGALHPRFLADGTSKYRRNGVGVSADGMRAIFIISDRALNFHKFARLFRDRYETPNALFFDGKVSRLWAPDLGRNDTGLPLGPIVGFVAPK